MSELPAMVHGEDGSPVLPTAEQEAYPLPASLLSPEAWVDTGEIVGGASSGRRVRSTNGRAGIRKPGQPVGGSEEAFREILAVVFSRWLNVSVPQGELIDNQGSACFVSLDMGPTALTWGTVMADPVGLPHRPAATVALQRHGGIVALDALIGAMDRHNPGNHLYVPTEDRWYGIDYSYSFNVQAQHGLANPDAFVTPYFPEMLTALRAAPDSLKAALALAEAIPDEKLAALCALPPPMFANDAARENMLGFLTARRARLRTILQEWCKLMTLDGLLDA